MKNIYVGSGGGGRGTYLHAGILTALQEYLSDRGEQIDGVTGTSAGGLTGAKFSLNPTSKGIAEMNSLLFSTEKEDVFGFFPELYAFWQNIRFRIDPNSIDSFTRRSSYRKWLRSVFGNVELHEAKIPIALTGVNISTKKPIILTHNHFDSMVNAVHVTTAEPPLLPPLHDEAGTFIDGGLMVVLPVAAASSLGIEEPYRIWAALVTDVLSRVGTEQKRGILNIAEHSLVTLLKDNTEKSIELLKSEGEEEGIESHLIDFDPIPGAGEGLFGFFDKKKEIWKAGYERMKEYLKNPNPQLLGKNRMARMVTLGLTRAVDPSTKLGDKL